MLTRCNAHCILLVALRAPVQTVEGALAQASVASEVISTVY